MRLPIVVFLLLASGLAGCSEEPEEEEFEFEEVVVDIDEGLIRGVVVDSTVTPIGGATVTIVQGEFVASMVTADDGLFQFIELAAGAYMITAEKAQYFQARTQTTVIEGDSSPDIVKLVLDVNDAERAYPQQYQFDGYIECSVTFVAAGLAACSTLDDVVPNNDQFMVTYDLDKAPSWIQSEMIWESSQSVSTELQLQYSYLPPGNAIYLDWAKAMGPSPVVVQANETLINEYGVGINQTLFLRIFNHYNEGTAPHDVSNDPTDGDDCYERPPPLGGCMYGVGLTVQQAFRVITTVFYGYEPGESWRFYETGVIPDPPEL